MAECRLHSELCDAQGVGSAVELPYQPSDQQSTIDNQQSPIPPIILDLSPTVHRSPLANLFAPSGFLFPYVASALIVGIGLLIGWTCRVSLLQQLAPGDAEQVAIEQDGTSPIGRNGPESAAHELDLSPLSQPSVGRISGLVNCRWPDRGTETFDGAAIRLGSKYALAAGFMEITYDTGAKVILQGPCTYEVESAAGGFLVAGQADRAVERKGEVEAKEEGSEVEGRANRQPSLLRNGGGTNHFARPSPLAHQRCASRCGER